jgi:hypothetical protein
MTNETLKNPSVVTIPNPVGIDLAISNIQSKLGELTWLEKAFGRAWNMNRNIAGDKRIEPVVYQSGSEYYPVLPNDALKSFCFFVVPGPRSTEEYNANTAFGTFFFKDTVSIIFWLNLQQIDPSKDYIFKEELLKDVLAVLNKDSNVLVSKVWDDRIEDIYKGFTLFPTHRDLLMYPYSAFRIEMDLSYQFNC